MEVTYENVMKRVGAAEQEKNKWTPYLEDLYDYFMPSKSTFNKDQNGQPMDEHIFDSTAIDALADYANRMESQLVPAGREWMKLESGSDIPKEQETEVDAKLEDMTKIVFNHINSSNFSSQINECFLDLGISTGAIIVEEGDGIQSALRFRAVPTADILIERSEKGIIDTVFRKLKMPCGDISSIFPQIEPTGDLAKMISEKPTEEVEFIEGVMLNENNTDYTVLVLYEKAKDILFQETVDSTPWIVFRESTTPGESYGRGRAMRCLNDVKTLNKVVEYYVETCELLGNPIYTAVDDGIINPAQIVIKPKSIIPVGANDTITPLPHSGSPELNMDLISRLQDSIRRTMLSKPFGNIEETPVRTATEMSIRNADLAQTTGAASGRVQTELLERIVKRSVEILKAAGKLADFSINGKEVKIKFTSPNARQQDEIDLATTLRYMEVVQSLPPELVRVTVKVEDFPKHVADIMGLDKKLLRTESERALEKKRIEEEQKNMMAQQAQAKGA